MANYYKDFGTLFAKYFSKEEIEKAYAKDLATWINKSDGTIATSEGNHLQITKDGMDAFAQQQNIQFLDLKQYFKNSSKAKATKNGGWYLIVPIGNKVKDIRPASNSSYNSLKNQDFGTTESFGDVDKFQDVVQKEKQTGVIDALRYQWKSSNVTRVKNGGRAGYISFRTVSDKSDPASWIIGREAFQQDNPELKQSMIDDINLEFKKALLNVRRSNNILGGD